MTVQFNRINDAIQDIRTGNPTEDEIKKSVSGIARAIFEARDEITPDEEYRLVKDLTKVSSSPAPAEARGLDEEESALITVHCEDGDIDIEKNRLTRLGFFKKLFEMDKISKEVTLKDINLENFTVEGIDLQNLQAQMEVLDILSLKDVISPQTLGLYFKNPQNWIKIRQFLQIEQFFLASNETLKEVANLTARSIYLFENPSSSIDWSNMDHVRLLRSLVLISNQFDPPLHAVQDLVASAFHCNEIRLDNILENVEQTKNIKAFLQDMTDRGISVLITLFINDEKLKNFCNVFRDYSLYLGIFPTDDNVEITNDGLAHLAHLTQLTQLDLISTQITDQGLRQLEDLYHLQHLTLIGCSQITNTAIQRLHQKLPNLKIQS